MIRRCYDPNNPSYCHYGRRGIVVCERWFDATEVKTGGRSSKSQGFLNFYNDMSETWFSGATIDRIDNDGIYTPENCQWLSRSDNVKKENQKKLNSGVHHFSSGKIQRRSNKMRVENGTHNFLGSQQLIGKVNVYDSVLGCGCRVTKEEYLAEKNTRYFAPNSKIARGYRNGTV
jgi:hypothetical protein